MAYDIDYCEACEDLETLNPSLIVNGFSTSNCNHLKEDEGLTGSNDDCEDLNTLNDCLIGSMSDEAEISDVCGWQDYMKKFVPNVWTLFKALICAICGIWENIHNLWAYAKSYKLTKTGNKISLTASDGNHGTVIDDDTTYNLSRSGHTITLTGSDGTTDSVTIIDDDTTYNLSRSGHTITLTGSDGTTDSVTIPDEDTWQRNTSKQDGYVDKGEDDPNKVWCTNSDGIPNWRNSPTLGGSLTLYNHDGAIGETKYWGLDTAKSIRNDSTTGTNAQIKTVTLTKGTWVVAATLGYEPNGTGVRGLGISFGNASHRKGTLLPACNSQHETILCKTYIHTVSDASEDVYIDTYQDSGGSLNLMVEPETYVNCVRIC